MVTLNKNQRRFFEESIRYFGDRSDNVRLKDINEFATEFDLIVPTSVLKKYCQQKGQTRGYYNILLSGVEPALKEQHQIMPDFLDESTMIEESSSFVEPVSKLCRKRFDPKNMVPIKFSNPVYILVSSDNDIISVYKRLETAYNDRILILHDSGDKLLEDVKNESLYLGESVIKSNNSQIWCVIIKKELK